MDARILNDRYRIESRLGDGGMAIVYCGTDVVLRRRVAIKILREQYASDEDFVKRFYYEAEAAAKLSHPNIVTTFDMGRDGDEYFIVMELVDGATLAEMIRADGRLPEPVAIDYGIQIASGLAYAHRQGLLHRDVKPANILVTSDDVVKLSDFGIARAVSSQALSVTQPGMVMGSVYYLSPEQAQGHDLAETSDLYSLGAVLYQMVTGSLPFSGDTPVTVALKHVSAALPTLELANANVSPALLAIVTRLLEKQPADRFASANDVAVALREARESPTLGTGHRGRTLGDAPTMRIEAVRAPQPPPRRSASPDRAAFAEADDAAGEAVAATSASTADRSGLVRALVFAMLLLVATGIGYALYQNRAALFPVAGTALPDVAGSSFAQAQQALVLAGFTVTGTEAYDERVPADHVVSQTPPAGTLLAKGGLVTLVVSKGRALVGVPDVNGFTLEDARKSLAAAGFRTRIGGSRYGPEPKDRVVAQNPPGGRKLETNGTVALVLSKGPKPPTVPSIVSLTLDQARTLVESLGLKVEIAREASDNVPENNVMSQDPRPGTQVASDAVISLVVSSGPAMEAIPDVSGKSLDEATSALRQAGFVVADPPSYSVQPANATGNVIAQEPAPGEKRKRNARVALTVAVAGTVPDVAGMSLAQAQGVLRDNGYRPGNVADSPDGAAGKVVRTEPEANSTLRPGESVSIYVGTGASVVPSPAPTAAATP